jgi:hypothetical protein
MSRAPKLAPLLEWQLTWARLLEYSNENVDGNDKDDKTDDEPLVPAPLLLLCTHRVRVEVCNRPGGKLAGEDAPGERPASPSRFPAE